jgi:hypothetical protein
VVALGAEAFALSTPIAMVNRKMLMVFFDNSLKNLKKTDTSHSARPKIEMHRSEIAGFA